MLLPIFVQLSIIFISVDLIVRKHYFFELSVAPWGLWIIINSFQIKQKYQNKASKLADITKSLQDNF